MTSAVRRQRLAAFDDEFAAHLQQLIDKERAMRAEMATVTVIPKRLPAEPLVRLVEGRGGLYACLGRHRGHNAERLDRAYWRACSSGHLSWKAADRLAIELLGLHPCLVWGETWFDGTDLPVDAHRRQRRVRV